MSYGRLNIQTGTFGIGRQSVKLLNHNRLPLEHHCFLVIDHFQALQSLVRQRRTDHRRSSNYLKGS